MLSDPSAGESIGTRVLQYTLEGAAGIALLAMMLITAVDVTGRYFFGMSIMGSVELIQLLLASVVFLAFPVVCWREEHVTIDLLDPIFPRALVWLRQAAMNALCAAALWVMAPTIWSLAERAFDWNDTTQFLEIPLGYLIALIAVMTAVSAALATLRSLLYLLEGVGIVRAGGPLSAAPVTDPERDTND